MKVVYVAGKLTGKNNFEISRNIRAAEDVAMEVVKLGAMPLIPHANTGLVFWGTATEEFWYAGTLELMRRCDAVLMVPGWEASKGAGLEFDEAIRRKIPTFTTPADLEVWLKSPPPVSPPHVPLDDFQVKFLVGGREHLVTVNIHDMMVAVRDRVLEETGNTSPTGFFWEMRLAPDARLPVAGRVIEPSELVGTTFLKEGSVIFLSPRADYGG